MTCCTMLAHLSLNSPPRHDDTLSEEGEGGPRRWLAAGNVAAQYQAIRQPPSSKNCRLCFCTLRSVGPKVSSKQSQDMFSPARPAPGPVPPDGSARGLLAAGCWLGAWTDSHCCQAGSLPQGLELPDPRAVQRLYSTGLSPEPL